MADPDFVPAGTGGTPISNPQDTQPIDQPGYAPSFVPHVDTRPMEGSLDSADLSPATGGTESTDTFPTRDPFTTMGAARMQGYDWSEIDGHLAQMREIAASWGHDPHAVDEHIGFTDASANFDRLVAATQGRLTQPTDENPILAASAGELQPSTDPDFPIKVGPLTPQTRQAYADALNDASTHGPAQFAKDYTDAIQTLTGNDVGIAQPGIAAQLPNPQEFIDYGVGLAQTHHLDDPEDAAIIRRNMVGAWATLGWSPVAINQHAHDDPMFMDGLIEAAATDPAKDILGRGLMATLAPPAATIAELASQVSPGVKKFYDGLANAVGTTAEQITGLLAGGAQPASYLAVNERIRAGIATPQETMGFLVAHAFPESKFNSRPEVGTEEGITPPANIPRGAQGPEAAGAPINTDLTRAANVIEPGPPMKFELQPAKQDFVKDKLDQGATITHNVNSTDGTKVAEIDVSRTDTSAHITAIRPEYGAVKDMPVKMFGPEFADEIGKQYSEMHPEVESTSVSGVSTPNPAELTERAVGHLGDPPPPRQTWPALMRDLLADDSGVARLIKTDPYTPDRVGDELDRRLHNLTAKDTADRITLYNWASALPDEFKTDAFLKGLRDFIEERGMNDNAKTMNPVPSARTQQFLDIIHPLAQEWERRKTALREKLGVRTTDPTVNVKPIEQGGLPRVQMDGAKDPFNSLDPNPDILQGAQTGVKPEKAQPGFAVNARRADHYVLEHDNGARVWGDRPLKDAGYTMGSKTEDPIHGGQWTVKEATQAEIEKNTDIKFSPNWVANMIEDTLRLGRIDRKLDMLAKTRDELEAMQLITKRDPSQPYTVPAGFRPFGNIPLLNNYFARPRIALAMNEFFRNHQTDLDGLLSRINRGMMSALFISPVVHLSNVGGHYVVGRGWDWMVPSRYVTMTSSLMKAFHEVTTLGPRYVQHLNEGSGLMYGSTKMRNFHQVLMTKAFHDILNDRATWGPAMKALGYTGVPQGVAAMMKWSRNTLWAGNDIMLLARQFELEGRGMSIRDAIKQSEEDIPNYRIPSTVMGSAALAQVLKSPNYMNFGRYKYGQIGALINMVKDMTAGTGAGRLAATGKLMALGLLATAVATLNYGIGKMFGDDGWSIRPPGPLSPINAAYGLWTHQKNWAEAEASYMGLSPVLEAAGKIVGNMDIFGKPLVNERSTTPGKVGEALTAAGNSWYPTQMALGMLRPGGVKKAVANVLALQYKNAIDPAKQQYFDTQDQKAAYKQENATPLAATLDTLFGTTPPAAAPKYPTRPAKPQGGMKRGF
jgi:hypothetical protein